MNKPLILIAITLLGSGLNLVACGTTKPEYNPDIYVVDREKAANINLGGIFRRCVAVSIVDRTKCVDYAYLTDGQVRDMLLTAPASFDAVIEMQKQCGWWMSR